MIAGLVHLLTPIMLFSPSKLLPAVETSVGVDVFVAEFYLDVAADEEEEDAKRQGAEDLLKKRRTLPCRRVQLDAGLFLNCLSAHLGFCAFAVFPSMKPAANHALQRARMLRGGCSRQPQPHAPVRCNPPNLFFVLHLPALTNVWPVPCAGMHAPHVDLGQSRCCSQKQMCSLSH